MLNGSYPQDLCHQVFVVEGENLNMADREHKSQIYDECQTESTKVLALPQERVYQHNSNSTPTANMVVVSRLIMV